VRVSEAKSIGNSVSTWKEISFQVETEIWEKIAFGRKLEGNIVIRREMRRKFYFIS
jgi:hypothetical protein